MVLGLIYDFDDLQTWVFLHRISKRDKLMGANSEKLFNKTLRILSLVDKTAVLETRAIFFTDMKVTLQSASKSTLSSPRFYKVKYCFTAME